MSSLNGSIALENELEGEEVTVTKSIDSLGSIALICNNMTGTVT